MNEWIRAQERRRREREHKEQARRVKLWAIESNAPHPMGCACWDCVLDLAADVMRHQAEMLVRRVSRRRPMVPR